MPCSVHARPRIRSSLSLSLSLSLYPYPEYHLTTSGQTRFVVVIQTHQARLPIFACRTVTVDSSFLESLFNHKYVYYTNCVKVPVRLSASAFGDLVILSFC